MKQFALTVALLLTVCSVVNAAVVLDAVATADCRGNTVVGTTGFTCATLTVGSGANRALVCLVDLSLRTATGDAMVWDSGGTNQSMTQIGVVDGPGTSTLRAELFGLVAPTSGAKTAKFTFTGTSNDVYIACVSYTGVDQTGGATTFSNFTSATGSASSAQTVTVTSAVGDLTIETGLNDANIYNSSTQTSVFNDSGGAITSADGSRETSITGASSVTHAWTINSVANWVTVGVNVHATGGGATCPATFRTLGVGC